jgi:hypothetical protein
MPDTMMTEEPIAGQPTWELTARSAQLGELFAAVAKAQGEIEGAKKDSTNPHFKSKYADLASARDAVQGPLSKNGLALIQWPRTVNNGVEIETWLGHASGQYMSGTLCMPCSKMDAHGVGSAITYGRRYALMAVTGVAPEDDDGNAAGGDRDEAGRPHFRPERRQMPAQSSAHGRELASAEPQLVDYNRPKGALPAGNGNANGKEVQNAIKRVEWVKKAIDGFKTAQTKSELQEWWKTETDRLGVIETAMPAEYERLLAAYDAAIERTAARAA